MKTQYTMQGRNMDGGEDRVPVRVSSAALAVEDALVPERPSPREVSAVPSDDVAAYMADMLLELRELARRSGFETLGRVLEIAEREAQLRVGDRR